ncbi:sensor histidine kinase [Paraburkholderia sp. 40]|uniref:sensor histidine kinase n=1 Tax=Paraburkholderia sp. 40 TaxID=2991059 RepID=UPI003D1CDBEB
MDAQLNPATLLGQLIGYGLSLMLAVLLAALAWRSPGEGRHARALNAACGAVWSMGGLTRFSLLAAGVPSQSTAVLWVNSLSFCAPAAWPICLLLFWNTSPATTSRRKAGDWLLRCTFALAVLQMIGLAVAPRAFPQWLDALHWMTGYSALAVLFCALVLLRPHISSAAERVGLALILLGPSLSMAAHWMRMLSVLSTRWDPPLDILAKQSIVLTMLGGLLYLGQFRAADCFAKLGLRVVLACTLGVSLAWIAMWSSGGGFALRTASDAAGAALFCAAATAALLLTGWIASAGDRLVDQRVFGRDDPQAALAELRERLAQQETQAAVFHCAEHFLHDMLNIEVRVSRRTAEAVPSNDLVAVPVGDVELFELSARHGMRRRALLSGELDILRQAGYVVGRRLEALERERERIETAQREASLLHQVVEAELRTLRAQINPHFLFNSLNTIAAMVHQAPEIAETMTLRLASIFRHVLHQSAQSFVPLHEETAFLKAYLEIEQIRFGQRLRVDFHIADQTADCPIPSLILQPLVENAIKHGFAPKLGECQLVVSAERVGAELILSVADNGGGTRIASANDASNEGVGMRNVRDRLKAAYGSHARFTFNSEPRRGSRATVTIPLQAEQV